ncbi:MAG: GTPase HflX [Desulfurococcales archaeon]|nr:GTPase HflX [Desulfurococcales archaeon]
MSGKTKTSSIEEAILLIPRKDIAYLEEALSLAQTAGYRVKSIVKLRNPRRLGRGLIEKIAIEAEENGIDTIIIYAEPPPTTIYQLQKATRKRVVDRVSLILEIFWRHAGSREAQLQIEAARIKHQLPLLREYVRRARMGEDPGFLGPGEYAIDKYRYSLERKLARIRRQLDEIRKRRVDYFERRRRLGMAHASLVGYASAGKTTLFNALTGETKPTGEEYFTTLHPKHKAIVAEGVKIVFVDTVGFIRKVPHEIIEAFKSTLEEVAYSDVIVFVVDVAETDRDIIDKVEAGLDTLANIGAAGLDGRLIVAANKVDLLKDYERVHKIKLVEDAINEYVPHTPVVPVSARTREGLRDLLKRVALIAGKTVRALGPLS